MAPRISSAWSASKGTPCRQRAFRLNCCQTSLNRTQRRSACELQAASIACLTNRPSRKVGQTAAFVSIALRKSRASMMIWS